MSRIHEALKQTSAPSTLSSPQPRAPRAEGVYVRLPEQRRRTFPGGGLIAFALLIACASTGFWLILRQPAHASTSDMRRAAKRAAIERHAALENDDAEMADDAEEEDALLESPAKLATVATAVAVEPVAGEVQSEPDAVATVATPSLEAAPVAPPAVAAEPVASAPQPPKFRLQGISYHPQAPSALINGKMLGVGEEVSGGMITRIDRSAVTLAVNGGIEVLRLP